MLLALSSLGVSRRHPRIAVGLGFALVIGALSAAMLNVGRLGLAISMLGFAYQPLDLPFLIFSELV